MKKITLLLLSAATLIAFSFITETPAFEGKITYSINLEGANMPPEAMAMFEGSELTIFIKGDKSRSDMNMGFQNTSTISDMKSGTSVTLMDMMGNKYKIKSNPSKEKKNPDVTVKLLDDKKDIAGYKCKKAELSFKDETGSQLITTIWYTDEISNYIGNNKNSEQFKGVPGMPLDYEIYAERGMKMKMTAQSISKETVPDSRFDIPSDYKETTTEDMQRDMMKMMGGGQH